MTHPSHAVGRSVLATVAPALTLVFTLVVAPVLLAGCGGDEPRGTHLTRAQLEAAVGGRFEPEDPATELAATCEGPLEAAADATQDCEVTTGHQRVGVRAVVTDIAADDLGLQLTPFLFGEDVAGAIAQSLEMQGYTGVETTCEGDLVGEVGRTLRCELSTPEGSSPVAVDVTQVDGLMIDYDFKTV